METLDRLCALLSEETAGALCKGAGNITEVRLRAGRPVQLLTTGGEYMAGRTLVAGEVARIAAALMDFSVYARESELRQGFFTLRDGCRAGVCGKVIPAPDGSVASLNGIGSLCVRVARALPGCAEALLREIIDHETGNLRSLLLLSPPGMGKTTMLRDIARGLSEAGICVGIADERHELAACVDGVPTMDVGPRTDVMDGGPKVETIPRMIRAMAPRAIVTDEIGGPGDAEALMEAARCGVAVVASAHTSSLADARGRSGIGRVVDSGLFGVVATLGGHPGNIVDIWRRPNEGRLGGDGAMDTGDVHRRRLHAVRPRHVRVTAAAHSDA